MVISDVAVEDRETRHLDVEQAFSKAPVDTDIYIKVPEKYQKFRRLWGISNRPSGSEVLEQELRRRSGDTGI